MLTVLTATACSEPTAPSFPSGARPLSPVPIQYATWWRMVESCSGLKADLNRVNWFWTFGLIEIGGNQYDGYWFGSGNRIVLSEASVRDGRVVRHEMLHSLLGKGSHPHEYFVTRCAAIAPCRACGENAGEDNVPTGARVVPTDSLLVSIAITPGGAPAVSIDSGWVTITVTATNIRPEPVWVTIPDSVGFGYVLAKTPGTFQYAHEPRWAFRAGQSRSLAFDFQLTSIGTKDTVWGFFGRRSSTPHPLAVSP